MSEALRAKHQLYPLIGILSAVVIMVCGLISAKSDFCLFYLAAVWFLLFVCGYWRSCIAVIPVAVAMCVLLAGITYLISGDIFQTLAAVNRILAVCIAVIPGLGMNPVNLVRNFSALKMPRILTLGMMITLNFFPLLGLEVSRVREAMKTRSAGSLLQPQVFYRAFLLPLVVRLVNIADTLSLSVETRGFSTEKDAVYSVYKTVRLKPVDGIYFGVLVIFSVWVVLL
ncbi:MAG: energy-coupling factor transporter transmembrane protein EcfT [Candidatus Gastranaerophilales bacterium]|nr:energy-coupling factor transporter transmembrane protein EcfT [Candidatus Gastranaerophilales bacterium]